jgi:hypothetical protein
VTPHKEKARKSPFVDLHTVNGDMQENYEAPSPIWGSSINAFVGFLIGVATHTKVESYGCWCAALDTFVTINWNRVPDP